MRNELEKFHHTVGILVKAYLNDTLEHANCHACAVGNMVAATQGIKLIRLSSGAVRWADDRIPRWFDSLSFGEVYKESNTIERDKKEAESTGYTYEEIARIEHAFEYMREESTDFNDIDFDGYKGLMAVVDVLADIHKVDLSVKEEAKAMFVKP